MNKSSLVLVLHCVVFFLLVICSLASPFVRLWYPQFYDSIFFPTFAAIMMMIVLGWSRCAGGCLLTRLENHYRLKENQPTYSHSFLKHYSSLLTGRPVPQIAVNIGLALLILFPILVRLLG